RGACVASAFAPEFDDEIAEAVHDGGVLPELRDAVDVADGAEPFGDTVEIAERLFERGEDRECGESRGLVALFEGEVAADEPSGELVGAVERSVAGDVSDPGVEVDELEVAGWHERRGQGDPELFEFRFDLHGLVSSFRCGSVSSAGS